MSRIKTDVTVLLMLLTVFLQAQTNPAAQALPFTFTSQSGSTLPAGMAVHRFGTSSAAVPTTRTTAAATGDLPYTSTSASGGWKDESASGLSLLASSSQSAGALIVAINTSGLSSINVSWKAGTILQQTSYDMSVALQYRLGTSGAFTDVGTTTTYTSQGKTAGDLSSTLSEALPSACDNQSVVQVRWIYWASNGSSGSRDRLNIDEINITSCNTPATQASNITFSSVAANSMTVNWTNGSGTNRIVKINTTGFFSIPVNGTTYAANSVYGGSEQVIYNGSGNSVTVTGLTAGTTYWFYVFEYSCSGTNTMYLTSGNTNNPNSQSTCTGCSAPGDYYRSLITGNWSSVSTWQSSSDNITWISATLVPTSAAASVTILSGHTVTIDAAASAPLLTINSGGTLQANSSSFVTLTLIGNLVNDGTLQMVNGTKGVDIIFNKNGNQTITGTGATTNFYSIGLNMGSVRTNYLDISPSNFSCSRSLLFNSSGTNVLTNGTIRFGGSFTWTGTLFQTGASYSIVATAGVCLNNSNVTISASNDSYDVSGLLRITAGTFNAGTAQGNSIRLLANSMMQMQGGTVNVAGRLQAVNSGGVYQSPLSYNQSGGTITLCTAAQNTSSAIADFDIHSFSDTVIFTGGTMVFRNEATSFSDLFNYGYCMTTTGGTIQFGDALTTAASFGFEMEVGPGSNVPSIVIDNSSGLNPLLYPGTDVIVKGGITIGSGTTLDNYWGNLAGVDYYYNFSLTKNWTNNGTFVHNNQMAITFNGSSAQTIGGTSTTGFNKLTINNSSGGVTLNTPAIINGTSGVLTLTNGFLYTSSSNTFTMNAGTSVSGASNSSFVYGPMSKVGSTSFTFPVGKDLKYRPIAISSLSGSETFTAEYFHSDPNAVPYDVTLKDPTLDDIGRCEYWILNRAGITNAKVALSWDTYSCGVTSLPNLAVARWDSSLGMWKDEGNTATTGAADPSTGTVTSGLVTSFSPFTLGTRASGVNPLPIVLLDFTAQYNSAGAVDLNWTTAAEVDNDYFTVERSADAETFTPILEKDGAGTTQSKHSYSSVDESPLPGVSYYRLRQTDFNGNFKYSATVSVEKESEEFEILNTYYSSSTNSLEISFNCSSNCAVSIELFDVTGKKVYSSFENTEGRGRKVMLNPGELSTGIYLLKASNGEKTISRKIKL
ncbi:MAG: T9SS type A sorting domain-containing protein [Bacteroidia bacterium]